MKTQLMRGIVAMLFFGMLSSSIMAQETFITYLMYDNVCMRKLDYQLTKGHAIDYYDFQVQLNNSQKVILRVFKAEDMYIRPTRSLEPNSTKWTCGETDKLNAEFADLINRSLRAFYVVERTSDGGYILYQVEEISFYEETPNRLALTDKRYNFSYNYDSIYPTATNLKNDKTAGGKILFTETIKKKCVSSRKFRSFTKDATQGYTDIVFMESIGLSQITNTAFNIQLMSINGTPLVQYVDAYCANKKEPVLVNKTTTTTTTVTTTTVPSTTTVTPTITSNTGAGHAFYSRKSEEKGIHSTTKTVLNPSIATTTTTTTTTNPATTTVTNPVTKTSGNIALDSTKAAELLTRGLYQVQEKDNVYKLAMKFNVTVDEIIFWNKLPNDNLKLRQVIKVKDDGSDPYVDPNPTTKVDENSRMQYTIHTVHHGDKLYNIAVRYKTTMVKLHELNDIPASDILQIGQQIIVAKQPVQ